MILHKGKVRLFDEAIKEQLEANDLSVAAFSKISINEKIKYVFGDVPELMHKIKSYYPEAIFLVKNMFTALQF